MKWIDCFPGDQIPYPCEQQNHPHCAKAAYPDRAHHSHNILNEPQTRPASQPASGISKPDSFDHHGRPRNRLQSIQLKASLNDASKERRVNMTFSFLCKFHPFNVSHTEKGCVFLPFRINLKRFVIQPGVFGISQSLFGISRNDFVISQSSFVTSHNLFVM
jgi:hypothetical protein